MKLPKYVRMKGQRVSECCLRLISKTNIHNESNAQEYYRDAGHWSVGIKRVKDKIYSTDVYDGRHPQLEGHELVECSKEEWQNDNRGYV